MLSLKSQNRGIFYLDFVIVFAQKGGKIVQKILAFGYFGKMKNDHGYQHLFGVKLPGSRVQYFITLTLKKPFYIVPYLHLNIASSYFIMLLNEAYAPSAFQTENVDYPNLDQSWALYMPCVFCQ